MEKKKIIIISVIVLVVVALIGGGSYAWFNYFQVSNLNNLLIAGDIRLKLQAGQDTISLSNVFPETKEEARSHDDNTLTFDVNGANTVGKAIRYNVLLNHGDDIANKVRFSDDELRFDLVEIIDNNEILLVENANFNTISNANLYDNIVPGSTNSVSHTYKLRMWIDEGVTVSETETGSHIYTPSEYKDLYATIKLSVKGETIEGDTYTLTFNPDGGTVPISTKSIVVGQDYGYLPTPTKEGYTFLGWNGKNMFNVDDFISTYTSYQSGVPELPYFTTFEGEDVLKMYGAISPEGRNIHYMEGLFNDNTKYTIKFDIYETLSNNNRGIILFIHSNDESNRLNNGNQFDSWKNIEFTFDGSESDTYMHLSFGISEAYSYLKNFQVEMGIESTAYEPFLVTSNTKVTEWNTNYVLKAIWQQD